MKPIVLIGIALIILGVVALVYQGITLTQAARRSLILAPSKRLMRPRRPSRCHPFWVALRLQVELCWSLLELKPKNKASEKDKGGIL